MDPHAVMMFDFLHGFLVALIRSSLGCNDAFFPWPAQLFLGCHLFAAVDGLVLVRLRFGVQMLFFGLVARGLGR